MFLTKSLRRELLHSEAPRRELLTQDASLSGANHWDDQVAWADALSLVDSVRNVTWDDWRMASISVAGGLPTGFAMTAASVVDCSTATELACRDNELGYMYYHNLGGTSGDDLTGNQGLIQNLANVYWPGTARGPDIDQAWNFSFNGAFQFLGDENSDLNAWAVRAGDVGVPEPGTMLLMGIGLVGLMAWRRVRRG